MPQRQLRLGAFMRPASIHTGAWRYPGAWPDMNFNFQHTKDMIQTLERGKFDAFFMADHMAVLNMPMDALKRLDHVLRMLEVEVHVRPCAGIAPCAGVDRGGAHERAEAELTLSHGLKFPSQKIAAGI